MNILIAEDDGVTRLRIAKFLKKWKHRVSAAPDGGKAFEMFSADDQDIVITDWEMPEMNGPELIKAIRANPFKPYVYIIMLTSRGDKKDILEGLFDIGADDYVVKPFDPDELQARISVGERTVRLERRLRRYNKTLEEEVRQKTKEIRETQEEVIHRLLTALEERSDETGLHVRRMTEFSILLARANGWTETRIDNLSLATPMHDVGKIGVPDHILLKPGRLTDAEFEIIKTHTTIGGRILGNSESPMLQMARDIALSHHERWDGTGYPNGICETAIPESARIVAIADSFDALSNDRVYRKALPEKEVLHIMSEGRGSHYDPFLYDMFMDMLPDFRRILAEYAAAYRPPMPAGNKKMTDEEISKLIKASG